MLVLITYDISTYNAEGIKRLNKVAKVCINYGQRVQNSVFECSVTPAQITLIKSKLKKIINYETDNIRIYYLGKNWERKVENLGLEQTYNPDKDVLIL